MASHTVILVSAAVISIGLPAGVGLKGKKAFAVDSTCDAEESLLGVPEMTLYMSCCEAFLQCLMQETHMHYPKHEPELVQPRLGLPLLQSAGYHNSSLS